MLRVAEQRAGLCLWGGLRALCADRSLNIVHLGKRAASSARVQRRIGEVLSHSARKYPLKDAAKFYETTNEKVLIWTNADLRMHVEALASGLAELGYGPGDKVVVWMPAGAAEYMVMLFGVARAGVTMVVVEGEAGLEGVRKAVRTHGAKGLIVWHGFGESEVDVVEKLAPGIAARDASGLAGFSRLSGKEFVCEEMPGLKHLVHTGGENVRGTLCFRNIMAYNPADIVTSTSTGLPLLIEANTGNSVTEEQLLKEAKKLGAELKLNADHDSKRGKIAVPAKPTIRTAAAQISALLHGSLFISPSFTGDDDKTRSVAESESATVFS